MTEAAALDPEDLKIINLARSARARGAGGGGSPAVRDETGRTYAAAGVDLPSLQLTAVQLAVAMAVSSGAAGPGGGRPGQRGGELDPADLAVLRDLARGSRCSTWRRTARCAPPCPRENEAPLARVPRRPGRPKSVARSDAGSQDGVAQLRIAHTADLDAEVLQAGRALLYDVFNMTDGRLGARPRRVHALGLGGQRARSGTGR